MKLLKTLTLFLISASAMLLASCDTGGSGPNDQPQPNSSANTFFDGLRIAASRGTVAIVDSSVDLNNSSVDKPRIVSFPDFIETAPSRLEKVEMGYDSDRGVSRIFLSIEGADRRFEVTLPSPEVGFQGLALSVTIPASNSNEVFCLIAAVADTAGTVSDASRGCLTLDAGGSVNERILHFATFEADSLLATLNFDTREIVEIGRTGERLGDIAFLGTRLFGVGSNSLFELNPEVGTATQFLALNTFGANALESRNGRLYVASGGGEFLIVNPATNSIELRASLGAGISSSGDLAFLDDGTLLLTAITSAATDELVRVEPDTGVATSIGEIGFRNVYGIGVFRGQLLGLTFQGEFILIDPATGRGALIAQTDALQTGGASIYR